ncbi:FAD-dependent oxidoreductase [Parapusillimonas granuli]|uniref:FAD-dependent oxidoreductase n=1 Tax=Parapusillimonas granuli TaxID=380911 RepID=A0A853G019_9BURK|nr:FAD-dependent oxidoreductase [Parapusillimonas granuli]MBB5215656.1 succinate dehydrogenase/fumarate reductase flavoprotein subunit [Parapusillimonas granuli]MEB2400963.1 FAD-dependent oxidoreductase [Alcaligenaceae bacterium]NYT49677.1 FAD-dependent oxidoreductase [Parapusillimonas granuli]
MEHPSSPYQCDVLVIGSGASGMSAAITAAFHGLEVLVVEKSAQYGGTTARSGGWLWIPGTRLATEQGIIEPPGAARAYLQHQAGTHFNGPRVDAFLEKGPQAVEFFTTRTSLRFDMPAVFPDYHAEAPGGVQGGRSMVTRPLSGKELGPFIQKLAPPLPELTVLGMMLASGEDIRHFMRAFKSWVSFRYVCRRLARHAIDVVRYGRGMGLTNGNALAGRLAKSALDLDIPIWLSTPAVGLLHKGSRVEGAIVDHEGTRVQITARRGVVLACGGFPHDTERRGALFPHVRNGYGHHSPSPAANTGDGLRLGVAAGGHVDQTIPHAAAWVPVSIMNRPDGSLGVMPHFIDRAKPGVIAVTARGVRFTNESNSYHDFAQDMTAACKDQDEVHAWLICDHKTLRSYGLGRVAPFPMPIGRHLRSGYLRRGSTISALAREIGVDAAALEATIARFNQGARHGEDPDFGRGSSAYNRFQGDPANTPNPCIAPVEKGPFYAIRLTIGDIGTFAGLVTDERTRVLTQSGAAIEGLYAVGNDAASIMGGEYPAAGITLGPALTFGYIAGMELAGRK